MNYELIKKCVCCGNSTFKQYSSSSYMGFPVLQCNDCGLFVSGGDENEMRKKANKIYEKKYWDERKSEEAIKSNFTDIESKQKQKKFLSQIKYCKSNFSDKKTLLEIGSGAGHSLYWFQKMGFTVTGVEPDERNVKLISKKLTDENTCITGFAEKFQTDLKFDVIWMSHVLEHTIRPDIILKKIAYMLNKNGLLFIEVPNCGEEQTLRSSIEENPSTFHFTKKSLVQLSKRAGYLTIKCDFFMITNSMYDKVKDIIERTLNNSHTDRLAYHYEKTNNEKAGFDLRGLFLKEND